MPSFLAELDDIHQEGLVLKGEELHHLRVRRCQVGEVIEVIDGQGGSYSARLDRIDGECATAAILSSRPERGEARLALTLACALIKGDRFDAAVEKSTEVGIRRITPIRCIRSIARDASKAKLERWRRIAQAAAKQSGRSRIPEVQEPVDFEMELAQPVLQNGLRLLAVARAEAPSLAEVLSNVPSGIESVTLFIGPEGGFAPEEEQQAIAAGLYPFSWGGDRALRVDTAAVVLSALVLYQLGGYDETDVGN
jgi:16S rRNA (uracil1498-N3)-methyltransferase